MNECRNCVDDETQVIFVGTHRLLGSLPRQNVVQEAFDFPRSLVLLQKSVGRDVVGVLANDVPINHVRMGVDEAQHEFCEKRVQLYWHMTRAS